MICDNILEAMGNTPIIRLHHLAPENGAEILVKFEGLNVGGSIKTRTAYNMIRDAEERGIITKDTIVEEEEPRLVLRTQSIPERAEASGEKQKDPETA